MSDSSRSTPLPPDDELDDPLWALLAQVPPPPADPMFSRQVMRAIRVDHQPSLPWWRRLLSPIAVSTATAACGIILGFSFAFLQQPDHAAPNTASHSPDTPALPIASIPATQPADFDIHPLELYDSPNQLVATIAEHSQDYSNVQVLVLLGL